MLTLILPQMKQPATVRRWLKMQGERIAKGDVLFEAENEETLIEVITPHGGILKEILIPAKVTFSGTTPVAQLAPFNEEAAESGAVAAPATHPMAPGTVIPVLMPQAGQSMEEGTIVKWRVEKGARIKKGQPIFDIETDKAVVEIEAACDGRLARIVVPEGGSVAVKKAVAYLAEIDADVETYCATADSSSPKDRDMATERAAEQAAGSHLPPIPADRTSDRKKISPAARSIARERGIDLDLLESGSGPRGRILSTDLVAEPSRKKLSRMRKAISATLQSSKQTIPHFYVRMTLDADPSIAFYKAHKSRFACSINDVITAACAKCIDEFPRFRSRIEMDEIVEVSSVNIGIAVSVEDGLVVPTLVDAGHLTLAEIAARTRRIAEDARKGRLEGPGKAVFTITNLGMFGVEEFAAIINPPEAAILAVGAARESAVVKDGVVRSGRVMTVTLSCDHRVIDGHLAAKFLARLKELLETPESWLRAGFES